MTALLDVNVLVALAWPNHVHHHPATAWFQATHRSGWATCPVTQSGFIRVSSNRRVIPDARPLSETVAVLRAMTAMEGHTFWTDDVALTDATEVDFARVRGYRQVTDVHLLTLASRNGGSLLTFDSGLADLGVGDVAVLAL